VFYFSVFKAVAWVGISHDLNIDQAVFRLSPDKHI